jgi:hypothetical protein
MTIDRDVSEKAAAAGATPAHEPDVVAARPVWIGIIAIVLLLVLGYLVPTALEYALMEREARLSPPANPLAASEGSRLPPAPRLQVNPARDIAELRLAEDRILGSYGWVDRSKGIARIPIALAMRIAAEKGLPAPPPVASRPPETAPPPSPPANEGAP